MKLSPDVAYAIWRFNLWLTGDYGSYKDIEWARGIGLLEAWKEPRGIRALIARLAIAIHRKRRGAEKIYSE